MQEVSGSNPDSSTKFFPAPQMSSTIAKKGDHEPTKYFEGEGELTKTEELTEQKISTPEKLDDHDVENLCSKFLMNIIYYKMAKKKQREKALDLAAGVIIAKGKDIQSKLNRNDLELKKIAEKTQNQDQKLNNQTKIQPVAQQSQSTKLGTEPEKGGKSDIPKISGGTLSEVIAKIAEMLAGKSGEVLKKGANNFSALIEVLATPEIGPKFDDVMKHLAKDPVLVVDIKGILKETPAAGIFDAAVEKNFNSTEKIAVSQVQTADLQARKQGNESNLTLTQNLSPAR